MSDACIDLTARFAGMNVLVVGHTGFKGSWLTFALKEAGARVWGFSLAEPEDPRHAYHELRIAALLENSRRQFGDVRDLVALQALHRSASFDVVFHVAAQAVVSEGYASPHFTLGTNAMGVANSLELHRLGSPEGPLVVVTSDKAYRNKESRKPYVEDDELFGDDPYSASKAMAEAAVHTYRFSFPESRRRGLASVRAGNVFGGGDWSPNRLVPDCARQLSSSREVMIRMPQAVRPWTYVLDVVSGYMRLAGSLLDHPEGFSGAWNFASGELLTVEEVARIMAEAWEPQGSIRSDGSSIGHETGFLQIDASKARGSLGWRPLTSVDESLRRTAVWYLEQCQGLSLLEGSREEVRKYLDSAT